MKKKIKTYSPFELDTDKDEPTFVGNSHRWWLIEISRTKRFCIYVTEKIDTKKKMYVLLDNKTEQVVRDTESLDDILIHMEVFDRALQIGG